MVVVIVVVVVGATVVAVTYCDLLVMNRGDLEAVLEVFPEYYFHFPFSTLLWICSQKSLHSLNLICGIVVVMVVDQQKILTIQILGMAIIHKRLLFL